MKKILTIGLIIAFIVVAHVIVIRIFWTGKPDTPPANTAENQTADDQKLDDASGNVAAGNPVTGNPAALKSEIPTGKSPSLGKFFQYKDTIEGNIPCLPLSAEATSGILVNIDTRKVIWAKNQRDATPIASMTKMMTLLLAFEEMEKRPDLTLETPIKVSPIASKIGGSQVYLDPKETFPLGELLKTIAIKSANDSAYQVADFLSSGDVSSFVARMNKRAKQLKMPSTEFVNPNGLPADSGENSKSSPEGMALLAERLLEYPALLKWTSSPTDSFRDKSSKSYQVLTNTNKLVRDCPGVNGMKTGFIRVSGFCITVTCTRGGKRLVAVVTGFPSGASRNLYVRKLLDWGYRRDAVIDDQEALTKFDKSVTNVGSKNGSKSSGKKKKVIAPVEADGHE
jgi:D-alanyl-D-alanine carboxypeptidase